jgi:hypothetical protein
MLFGLKPGHTCGPTPCLQPIQCVTEFMVRMHLFLTVCWVESGPCINVVAEFMVDVAWVEPRPYV